MTIPNVLFLCHLSSTEEPVISNDLSTPPHTPIKEEIISPPSSARKKKKKKKKVIKEEIEDVDAGEAPKEQTDIKQEHRKAHKRKIKTEVNLS